MVGNLRDRALDNSKRELENTVLLLSRHFDQQLADLEAVQKDLIAYVQSTGIDTPEQFSRRMSSPDIRLMLASKLNASSYVGGVNVFDASGCSEMQDYLFSPARPAAEVAGYATRTARAPWKSPRGFRENAAAPPAPPRPSSEPPPWAVTARRH